MFDKKAYNLKYRKKNKLKIRKASKDYYYKNKESLLKKGRETYSANRRTIMDRKNSVRIEKKQFAVDRHGGKCKDCKRKYPLECYDFHHLDPSKKDFEISRLRNRSLNIFIKETDKCALLCANCHRIRHAKEDKKRMSLERKK